MRPRLAAFCSVMLLAAAPVVALEPYLVKDINPIPQNQSSDPREFVSLDNGIALFLADLFDREIWRSDGTVAGTYKLSDICPRGFCGHPFFGVAHAGDRFFYLAETQESPLGLDLWVTGGSAGDTFNLGGPFNLSREIPPVWVASRGLLFFVSSDQEHGMQLWRSDGTRSGTYRLTDQESGFLIDLAELRGKLYFKIQANRPGQSALWTSDGTPGGTRLVKDVSLEAMRSIGSALIFFGPGQGGSLWRSDGTAKGTVQISTIASKPGELTLFEVRVLAGRYYFTTRIKGQGEELWASDGTKAGTRRLTNFVKPRAFRYESQQPLFLPTLAAGARVVFAADDGVHGAEPWVTNGTPAGTRLLRDVCPGACESHFGQRATFGPRLIFAASTTTQGVEPWITDGTPVGTRLLRDICAGTCSSTPYGMVKLGGGLIFGAQDDLYGFQLWKTDGTPGGTTRLTAFPREVSAVARIGAAIPGAVLYSASSLQHGLELWRTDGTAAGSGMVLDLVDRDIGGSSPRDLFALGDRLLFLADDGLHGRELWTSDGTEEGTRLVRDTPPYPAGSDRTDLTKWVTAGGIAYLLGETSEGRGVWRTDGTEEGTYRLAPDGVSPNDWMVASGNRVFFPGPDAEHGRKLWTSDGTAAGTRVLDVQPSLDPWHNLVSYQGSLYFEADLGAGKTEIWKSDGIPESTVPVPFLDSAELLGEFGGRLWFGRWTAGFGEELWSTDGTEAGTRMLGDIRPGENSFSVEKMFSAGSRMFLDVGGNLWVSDGTVAGTRNTGVRSPDLWKAVLLSNRLFVPAFDYTSNSSDLWVTDGSESGTKRLLSADGARLTDPENLVALAGQIWFTQDRKIWRTDGTDGGTVEVATGLSPNPELVPVGGRLFYPGWTPELGWELWAIAPQ